jgi:hypothetical protein
MDCVASAQEQALDAIEAYTQGVGSTQEEEAKAKVAATKATANMLKAQR